MPISYRLTPDARADLIEIRRFTLRQWGKAQSRKYLSELRSAIHLLVRSPALGKSRPEIGANVSSFPHASHVIYYLLQEGELIVFGVLHKRMAPLHHLAERPVE